jgi:hypothetical protein
VLSWGREERAGSIQPQAGSQSGPCVLTPNIQNLRRLYLLYEQGPRSLEHENPLRPRFKQPPKRMLSDAELQRYGLRRKPGHRGAPASGHSPSAPAKLKKFALIVWNGPAILLSRLTRRTKRP